jgi:thiopurine S-methyltransferase
MKGSELDKDYWDKRYRQNDTGWDIGYPSTPLREYIDQLDDKSIEILIPGGGNAYEAEYLCNNGFKNVFLLDLSATALESFSKRVPSFPKGQLLCEDFFGHSRQYDLILEQTFFCAIDPSLRAQYAEHMFSLLRTGGKLVGLLFNDKLNNDKPPFGGSAEEYEEYFKPWFSFRHFGTAYNSISPRAGRELFITLVKEKITGEMSGGYDGADIHYDDSF